MAMKNERSDRLRRRPKKIRYFYLAVSRSNLHAGMSYGGLNYVKVNHGVVSIYVADLATLNVIPVEEPVEDFMRRWRAHYNEPLWDYGKDIADGVPAPVAEEGEV